MFAIGSNLPRRSLLDVFATGLLILNESLTPQICWDTTIASVIPNWKLLDPVASAQSTITDLMAHRTGLPAYDFAYFLNNDSIPAVYTLLLQIEHAQYLKPSLGFRVVAQYNNIMYAHILGPLGLNSTTYLFASANKTGGMADGFARDGLNISRSPLDAGTTRIVPFLLPTETEEENSISGAGGLLSNAIDTHEYVLAGYHSRITRFPDDGAGVAILTDDDAFGPPVDWDSRYQAAILQLELAGGTRSPTPVNTSLPFELSAMLGAYRNMGYGADIEPSPFPASLLPQTSCGWDCVLADYVTLAHFDGAVFNVSGSWIAMVDAAKKGKSDPQYVVCFVKMDQDLIDSLPTHLVTRFRSSIFQHEYIESNAALFVSHDWIDMAQPRKFLARAGHAIQPEVHPPLLPGRVKIEESSCAPSILVHPSLLPGRVKIEEDRLARLPSSAAIKIEDDLAVARQLSASGTSNTLKTRVVKEGGIDILEILTDSESDEPQHGGTGSSEGFPDPGPSFPLPPSDFERESTCTDTDCNLSSDGLEAEPELPESDIPWLEKDATIEAEIAEMNETRKQAAERLKELKALKSATKKSSSKSAGKSRAVVASSSSSGRVRPRPIASNPLRIHAEQAAPSTSSTTIGSSYFAFFMASSDTISIEFDPMQGQDMQTTFGNTSGSQANVAATVAFAPPTEHFPAPPAAQMAASSDTSRSDSAPIDFNALDDLSDTDFFAFLDTINSMPMPAVPQIETDNTFGFFGDGFAYGLIPDASFDMQTDDFAGTTLSLPTLPLPPASPPMVPAVTAAASTESMGDGNRKRKHKNEVNAENIVYTKRAKRIPRHADEWYGFLFTVLSIRSPLLDLIAPGE
ncbi:hypothetical protein DFH08DRAFT_1017783 [Mycena albidolilacea]|uniref:Beta-lactamase-related domain-containing protein n=1 Tax=Mycena albidolilacea TaxID=1033008 RepID=A0AAD6ZSP1_9AGAR|nr:hypothetical protein DFH08DRAFT_1017783 [Mycena albidolilacea]